MISTYVHANNLRKITIGSPLLDYASSHIIFDMDPDFLVIYLSEEKLAELYEALTDYLAPITDDQPGGRTRPHGFGEPPIGESPTTWACRECKKTFAEPQTLATGPNAHYLTCPSCSSLDIDQSADTVVLRREGIQ